MYKIKNNNKYILFSSILIIVIIILYSLYHLKRNNYCFKYEKNISNKYSEQQIFYSPKLKSCLHAYWTYEPVEEHYVTRHNIKNLKNDKIIFSQTDADGWWKKINELK